MPLLQFLEHERRELALRHRSGTHHGMLRVARRALLRFKLLRYSLHFFEWCVWIGYAVYGLAFGWYGLIAIVGQAIIVGSIFGVTGVPPTEAQAVRSKGDAYREYQKRVSRFVPMPPESHRRDA